MVRNKTFVVLKYRKKLFVDHDHKTKIVRGLLCRKYNIGLDYFKDNIISLQRVIKYLENGTEKS